MPQLAKHLGFDLPDALAGDVEVLSYLFQGVIALLANPETHAQNLLPYLAIRTRYFDDILLAAVRGGSTQVVILAAGMDARAFRLDLPEGTVVYEVERAEVLTYK